MVLKSGFSVRNSQMIPKALLAELIGGLNEAAIAAEAGAAG